jgi:signal transduction histidine kinase
MLSVHAETAQASPGAYASQGDELLEYENVKLVFAQMRTSQFVALANALVLGAVESLFVDTARVLAWLAIMFVVTLARLAHAAAFARAQPGPAGIARWRRQAVAGAAAAGLAWGSATLLLQSPANGMHQVFVAFVQGGMVAGAASLLAPLYPAFAWFALGAVVPAIFWNGMDGDVLHYAMAWMMAVFMVTVLLIGRRIHNSIAATFRLRFENVALIRHLTEAKTRADALNVQLQEADRALRHVNEELEHRVEARTADLARINAELEQFAFIASHDLQEPLRTTANFALLLEERYREKVDEDGREFIGYIVSGVTHMRRLIDGLLLYSRAGARPDPAASAVCGAIVGKVLANLRAAIEESGAVVVHGALPTVRADSGQVEQLFLNLIGNAIKFRSAAPLRVTIGAERDADCWVISVADNGIGIDPRYKDKIFEMFERLHGAGRYPGTGIGLALCRKIVESTDGRIWVESEEGRGAVFRFTLPAAG